MPAKPSRENDAVIFDLIFAALSLTQAALLLWSLSQVRRFLESTPVIADELSLDRYKAFVRVQMYLALIPLALVPPGMALALMVVVQHGAIGLVVVLALNAYLFALVRSHKRWEARARSLEVRSDELQVEYRKVSEAWLNRPLPSF